MFNLRALWMLVAMMAVLLWSGMAHAQFDPAEGDSIAIDVGVGGTSGTQSHNFGIYVPIDQINGVARATIQQAIVDSEVISDAKSAYVEGGVDWKGANFRLFVEANQNLELGLERSMRYGWFVRPVSYEKDGLLISGGVGTFLQDQAVAADLRMKLSEPTTINLLAFALVRYHGVSTLIRYTPDAKFTRQSIEFAPTTIINVKDQVDLGLSATVGYDELLGWNVTYSGVLRLTFK